MRQNSEVYVFSGYTCTGRLLLTAACHGCHAQVHILAQHNDFRLMSDELRRLDWQPGNGEEGQFRDLCPHCKPAQEWHFYDGIIPEVENGYI